MKYFVPITKDAEKAEAAWAGMRLQLGARGFPTELRRIHSLWFRQAGVPRVLQVGVDDSDTGEPVIFILRALNAPLYWVLTPGFGIMEGAPMPVPVAGTKAVEFD